MTLDELHALLKSESKFIEQQNKALTSSVNPTAMFSRGSNPLNLSFVAEDEIKAVEEIKEDE